MDELIGQITIDPELSGEIEPDLNIASGDLLPSGPRGKQGKVWLPDVDEDGELTWEQDDGQTQPEPANIKGQTGEPGPQGEIGPMGRVYFPTFYVTDGMELIMKDDFGYDRNIEFEIIDGHLVQKVG